MSLHDSARTSRDLYWTRRGIDEFGGGFLGLLLLKLTEKSEQAKNRKASGRKDAGFFDRLANLFCGNTVPGRED